MSTADWPEIWSKDYETLLCLFGIFARKQKDGNVQLWQNDGADRKAILIGVVPEDITYPGLRSAIPLMVDSYRRGVIAGRGALAAEVLAPISEALNAAKEDTKQH